MFDAHMALTRLADLIARKELSPVEVLRAYLERIERFNGELNAIVTLHPDRALAAAREVEQRIVAGEDVGPLAGVPFVVKDLEDVAGMLTTFGSPLFRDNVADARLDQRRAPARRWRVSDRQEQHAGVRRLHADQQRAVRPDPQPLEPRTHTGRIERWLRSGVGGGLIPLATASDGGGSIRHPAAFAGCVGLKPTFRRVAQRPDPVLTFDDTGVWGPLTLTVRDAARLADITFGPSEEDPTSLPAPAESYEARLDEPLGALRIGYGPDFGCFVQPDVAREVEASVRAIEGLGHAVEIFNQPIPFVGKAWSLLGAMTEYLKHGEHTDAGADLIDPMILDGMRRMRERARRRSRVRVPAPHRAAAVDGGGVRALRRADHADAAARGLPDRHAASGRDRRPADPHPRRLPVHPPVQSQRAPGPVAARRYDGRGPAGRDPVRRPALPRRRSAAARPPIRAGPSLASWRRSGSDEKAPVPVEGAAPSAPVRLSDVSPLQQAPTERRPPRGKANCGVTA